jgi:hypothetical protein
MRTIVTILSAVSLAACTAAPGGNNAAAPAPVANAANAAVPADDEAAGLARVRSEWLEACIGGGRDAAPPGTPVDRHCACAIDRVMAGKTLAEVREERASGAYRARFSAEMRACIREIRS